jgi:signal transduction histidine kinase
MIEPAGNAGRVNADREIADLLARLARDVTHELRGPVQSVVVNLEVLRRRAAKGEIADVENRAAIVEEEVRRLHSLADAFVGLVREPAAAPAIMSAAAMLAVAGPLVHVIAKARHVAIDRRDPPPDTLVRVRPEPAALAIVRLVLALCENAGERATLVIEGDTGSDTFTVSFELRPAGDADGDSVTAMVSESVAAALPAANAWLLDAGGTATLDAVSKNVPARVRVMLHRAT